MGGPSDPATEEAIRWAYRVILGREPDAGGLARYAAEARDHGLTLARLREIFLSSEEFRSRARQRVATVEMGGHVVVVDPEEPAFGAAIARHGTWEPHLGALLDRNLRPGDVVVDVGANVGVFAFRAARLVGPAGRVIAFEPDPANAALFLRGVAANRFGHVTLFPLALSDRRAVFALQGGANAWLVPAGATEVMAQAVPGDEVLATEPRVDFVKLDIEGHEPFALRGLARILALHRPLVLCEFNPRCLRDHAGQDPAGFADAIFALAGDVTAIGHDGTETPVVGAGALLALWEREDRRATESGLLPAGMLHLDLLFRPG